MPQCIPVFTSLLGRHDLSHLEVMIYGLVASMHARGQQITTGHVSAYFKTNERHARRAVHHLDALGLTRRRRCRRKATGSRRMITSIIPLGPLEAENDNGQE